MRPLPTRHPANSLLPLHPTHLLALKPLLTPPRPCYPISPTPPPPSFPPCNTVTYPTHVSPERGGRTRGPHPSPCAIFIVRYDPDRKKLGSFSENPTRHKKEFLRFSQAYNLTWSDVYYILNAILTPDEKDHIWQAQKPTLIIYITKMGQPSC